MLLSVGSLFALSIMNARVTLLQQLARDFDTTIAVINARIDDYMSSAQHQLEYLQNAILLDPSITEDPDRLGPILRASFSSSPQVTAVAFFSKNNTSVRAERDPARVFVNDLTDREDLIAVTEKAEADGPDAPPLDWSDPIYSENIGHTIIVYRKAVWRGSEFLGLLFAATDLNSLSEFTKNLSEAIGQTVFILSGDDGVIAHPKLTEGGITLSGDNVTPVIDQIDDENLKQIWSEDRNDVISASRMQNSSGHFLFRDDGFLVFIYARLTDYGIKPWTIGYHFTTGSAIDQVRSFWRFFALAAGLLAVFLLAGVFLGRWLSGPIRRLTEGAIAVSELRFNEIKPIGGSNIVELDRATASFNSMISGLKLFMRYVPQKIVETAVKDGRSEHLAEERELTLFFADIAGFTGLSENFSPSETAEFLNEYLSLMAEAIQENDGTLDKFTGDGLLAFWGAPERLDNHARSALQAAHAIRDAFKASNAKRESEGLQPISVRIGIHTGPVIVGDIGSQSRINYTVVGDAVNVASRIETIGKQLAKEDAIILLSEDTKTAAGDGFSFSELGPRTIVGRTEPVNVYKLL
ncbi:MAG: adenylate/guanylate cyclase domain-containing protein [Pseudomonadota bacterium]